MKKLSANIYGGNQSCNSLLLFERIFNIFLAQMYKSIANCGDFDSYSMLL